MMKSLNMACNMGIGFRASPLRRVQKDSDLDQYATRLVKRNKVWELSPLKSDERDEEVS